MSNEQGALIFELISSQSLSLAEVKGDLQEGEGGFTDDPADDILGADGTARAALS